MQDPELTDEISDLEARIEELSASLERSRKFILAAKLAMLIGATWMLAAVLGVLDSAPAATIVAVSAIIGGIVLFGSTTATVNQISDAIQDAEARRAELIGQLELRAVE
jgi:outer membrane murein-binding lipoprotein Lpp